MNNYTSLYSLRSNYIWGYYIIIIIMQRLFVYLLLISKMWYILKY